VHVLYYMYVERKTRLDLSWGVFWLGLGFLGKKWIWIFGHESIRMLKSMRHHGL